MRGQTEIINARLAGQTPKFVFVNDYPCKTDWFEYREHATVCTHGDMLSSIDFRFLRGLRVSISASTENRAKALFALAKEAGASAVGACHVQDDKPAWDQSGWTEIFFAEQKEAVCG